MKPAIFLIALLLLSYGVRADDADHKILIAETHANSLKLPLIIGPYERTLDFSKAQS